MERGNKGRQDEDGIEGRKKSGEEEGWEGKMMLKWRKGRWERERKGRQGDDEIEGRKIEK